MTYEEIFEKSKKLILKNDASGIEGHLAVQVDITGEGEGAFYIELNDGKLAVEPYEYYDRDCKLIISGEDFLSVF
ncbi:MAG: SCP2 sterol-binding domain-containing protein, partial [Oscillospiraceae bacterium]|nr:SCP2 sterol-binding domain-containing protein [Oscillospiraceae bacterium]